MLKVSWEQINKIAEEIDVLMIEKEKADIFDKTIIELEINQKLLLKEKIAELLDVKNVLF
ncbi:MAG: hypothetical protein ACRC92_21495 [Peptostreptococcaceae bacterium]